MPTLKRYADSADNQGVYIHANVGGNSPVTLQVSLVAEKIFRLLEYNPPDTVPSKLVWSMYDVGLLYTLNSLSKAREKDKTGSVSRMLDQLDFDSTLSQEREDEIISELREYNGPDASEVEELVNRLQGGNDTAKNITPREITDDLSLLRQWVANSDKLLELLNSTEGFEKYASASIQTFAQHPYLSAPPVWLQPDGSIKYRLNKDNQRHDVYIYDHRYKLDYDFKVILERGEDSREIAKMSTQGNILNYQNEAGRIGSRINMSSLTDWVIPDDRILVGIPSSSEMYHSTAFTEYNGKKLEPIREPDMVESSKLSIVEVDRRSNSGNPVVERHGNTLILDQGVKGEKYLIEKIKPQRGRVISRVLQDSN
jgi:hypothetical protein